MRQKTELPIQKKPIYVWILTEDSEIEKLEPVTEYSITQFKTEDRVIMRIDGSICYTSTKSFDKLFHNKVYSFNDDDAQAKK